MATLSITQAQSVPKAITGINVDPTVSYSWDLKALFPAAAAADVIESPAFDLKAMAPKTNRLVAEKQMSSAGTDTLKLLVSNDGTTWFTAPVFNGGTGGGLAVANPNATEVTLAGLPSMRYVKAQLTLANAMSALTAASLALSFLRI